MSRWKLHAKVEDGALEVSGWRGGQLLREVGARPTWLGRRRAWLTSAKHAGNFLALAEARGAAVTKTGIEPAKPPTRHPAAPDPSTDDGQLALLDHQGFSIVGITQRGEAGRP